MTTGRHGVDEEKGVESFQSSIPRRESIDRVARRGASIASRVTRLNAAWRSRAPSAFVAKAGEASVFERELGGEARAAFGNEKRRLAIAGRDYAHETTCLACFGGGSGGGGGGVTDASSAAGKGRAAARGAAPLRGCKLCPMALHDRCAEALGCEAGPLAPNGGGGVATPHAAGGLLAACPHHACAVCARKAAAVGGMLFRCVGCPSAFCEDDLPVAATIVGGCRRLEARGVRRPPQACYIRCGDAACAARLARLEPAVGAAGDGAAAAGAADEPPMEELDLTESDADAARVIEARVD